MAGSKAGFRPFLCYRHDKFLVSSSVSESIASSKHSDGKLQNPSQDESQLIRGFLLTTQDMICLSEQALCRPALPSALPPSPRAARLTTATQTWPSVSTAPPLPRSLLWVSPPPLDVPNSWLNLQRTHPQRFNSKLNCSVKRVQHMQHRRGCALGCFQSILVLLRAI